MPEEFFYHALNLALESDRPELARLEKRFGTWENAWDNLHGRSRELHDLEPAWQKIENLGIRLILRGSGAYPPLLKEIPDPPLGIYVLGNLLAAHTRTLAIVGTRKGTPEGKELARRFAAELAREGFTIISGLALGIDAAAHAGCLEAKGKTIAILANGLGSFYPRVNERLAKNILGVGGAIVSEYPPGAPAFPSRFLERNRIVSGLSQGVLVIEAPEHSGSLVTARFALDQNREVFVVPGPISHPNFKGSNQLIRQGAELVTNPREILAAFGIEGQNEADKEHLLENDEEIIVFRALKGLSEPATIDKVIELTNLRSSDASRALTFLLVRNIIKETENGYTI